MKKWFAHFYSKIMHTNTAVYFLTYSNLRNLDADRISFENPQNMMEFVDLA